jgi:hypothetical protein
LKFYFDKFAVIGLFLPSIRFGALMELFKSFSERLSLPKNTIKEVQRDSKIVAKMIIYLPETVISIKHDKKK